MACGCDNITCIEVFFNPCGEGAELPIEANETGTWTIRIEFNGFWKASSFGVTDNENIVIPVELLNENYKHTAKIYDSTGLLVNDTCYTIKSIALMDSPDYPVIPPTDCCPIDVDITIDGSSFTDSRLEGKLVAYITYNGQSYNSPFWSKPEASDTLTSTMLSFVSGDIVTVTFK